MLVFRGLCNGLGPAAFGLLFHLFGINILADDLPATDGNLNATLSNNATVDIEPVGNIINFGLNSTSIEAEQGLTTLAVIVETLPGIPFLLMATCILAAIVAALFLDDITKGMDDQQTGQEEGAAKREVVEATSSSSQSENSETKMEVNGNSRSSSFADLKDGKLEVTSLSEEDTGKIHINGQTMKASYAA